MNAVLTTTMSESGWLLYACILMGCSLGFPFSSDLLMILGGSLASLGYFRVETILILSPLAILCGDTIAFHLGRRYGEKILQHSWTLKVFPNARQTQVRSFLHKNSRRFIFGVRFFPGLRSLIFVSAGSMQIPQKDFLQMNALSTCLYAPVLVAFSYWATEGIQDVVTRFQGYSRGVVWVGLTIVLLYGAKTLSRRFWIDDEDHT